MDASPDRAEAGSASANGSETELSAIVREIRERVRARHPSGTAASDIPVPNLLPLMHARDAAEGKVASIGTVNPRGPGLVNAIIQKVKRTVARALDWHVREQVEFNRAVMTCVQSTLEALAENNRALSAVGELGREARELKDVRNHWVQWRQEWERKLSSTETQFLRSLSDLQGAWQHRVTLMDEQYRGLMAQHRAYLDERTARLHSDYQASLDRSASELQGRMWADLDRIRAEYETIIHAELRLLRQKTSLMKAGAGVIAQTAQSAEPLAQVDWLKFAEKFRGGEAYVRKHLAIYVERFRGCPEVLDVGCGRGELLEVFRDAGIPARGIDLNDDCLALCRERGLAVDHADLFNYLSELPDSSLGGVVALQVVEHLAPHRVPELVALVHAKLRSGGLVAFETPNPECLAIFARHFYLDPTHARPIPPALLAFYLEEAGFGRLETVRLEAAVESMPSLGSLPEDFRRDFFGSLDYAIFGRKL